MNDKSLILTPEQIDALLTPKEGETTEEQAARWAEAYSKVNKHINNGGELTPEQTGTIEFITYKIDDWRHDYASNF